MLTIKFYNIVFILPAAEHNGATEIIHLWEAPWSRWKIISTPFFIASEYVISRGQRDLANRCLLCPISILIFFTSDPTAVRTRFVYPSTPPPPVLSIWFPGHPECTPYKTPVLDRSIFSMDEFERRRSYPLTGIFTPAFDISGSLLHRWTWWRFSIVDGKLYFSRNAGNRGSAVPRCYVGISISIFRKSKNSIDTWDKTYNTISVCPYPAAFDLLVMAVLNINEIELCGVVTSGKRVVRLMMLLPSGIVWRVTSLTLSKLCCPSHPLSLTFARLLNQN